jgi:hypothetical protein
MIRYRIDDLGCVQFEWLIQSLLKAELSLAVESWGGRGDMGRDAFCADSLPFPQRQTPSRGPFLFQMKFVENANAAGARPGSLVLDAVQKECLKIDERLASKNKRDRAAWANLKHYLLWTNAPVNPTLRAKIAQKIRKRLPRVTVHSFGASDICDVLDKQPAIRKSFPQLLGLRDLEELLQYAIDKKNIAYTRRVLEQARDVCPVFVPTSAYLRSWEVLREHSFAVLEGPPEMGKTAIALIVALAQVSIGWDAVICREPDDFFARIDEGRSQVFVADDAFGRTEYDPARGLKWEVQLGPIVGALDSKHWLLWTSRKHILERALRAMDFQLNSKRFPDPGAVLVDASLLSTKDKALMLYRHARAAKLSEESRALVRTHARMIVHDANFTPERIRRFVVEALPALMDSGGTAEQLIPSIREAIRNPTGRMRKSFLALSNSHKWFLISLLEVGDDNYVERVFSVYDQHCPIAERRNPQEVFDELRESFVKGNDLVDWMHPSYRDLVIEELSTDESLKLAFLQKMGLPGIKLAVSDTGGALGTRSFPLMTHPESWEILKERCLSLVAEGMPAEISELLLSLESIAKVANTTDTARRLGAILSILCQAICVKWNNERAILSHEQIRVFGGASTQVRPLPALPSLERSWKAGDERLARALKQGTSLVFEREILGDWLGLAEAIAETEPRLLTQIGFRSRLKQVVPAVLAHIRDEVASLDRLGDFDALDHTKYCLTQLANLLWDFRGVVSKHLGVTKTSKVIPRLIGLVREAKEEFDEAAAYVAPPPDEDAVVKQYGPSDSDFDIDALFEDL